MSYTKRKSGRPATGTSPMLALRLPKETTERLDSWCVRTGMSRSEAIRLMIQFGLTANPAVLREAIGRAARLAAIPAGESPRQQRCYGAAARIIASIGADVN